MRLFIVCALIVALCVSPFGSPSFGQPDSQPDESSAGPLLPGSSRTPLLRKVEGSINRGVKYLLARQNPDGSWGEVDATSDVRVGTTALVTLALLSCGESHQSKPLASAIKFLRTTRAVGRQNTYAIALRACVWASLPEPIRGTNLEGRPRLADDHANQKGRERRNVFLFRPGHRRFLEQPVRRAWCVVRGDDRAGSSHRVLAARRNRLAKSVASLCKDLWPRYSFRELAADHPVRSNNFPMNGWTDPIQGVSNGVRELAILMPSGDVSWKWQGGAGASQVNLSPYAPLGNLFLYLTDKSNARFKGEATWIDRDNSVNQAKVRRFVARLKYDGNWDPEPLGWRRIANLLHNSQDVEIQNDTIELASPGKLKIAYTLAHLTAAEKFDLKPAEREALKAYIDKGGTLLFDAAGGSTEATASFEALMAALYPGVKPAPISTNHTIYTGAFEGGGRAIESFEYRRGPNSRLAPTKLPRLKAYTTKGRIIAIESAEDLSAAMVGYPTGGITGYTPATAAQIVRNIVIWSDAEKKS